MNRRSFIAVSVGLGTAVMLPFSRTNANWYFEKVERKYLWEGDIYNDAEITLAMIVFGSPSIAHQMFIAFARPLGDDPESVIDPELVPQSDIPEWMKDSFETFGSFIQGTPVSAALAIAQIGSVLISVAALGTDESNGVQLAANHVAQVTLDQFVWWMADANNGFLDADEMESSILPTPIMLGTEYSIAGSNDS